MMNFKIGQTVKVADTYTDNIVKVGDTFTVRLIDSIAGSVGTYSLGDGMKWIPFAYVEVVSC